MNILVISDLHLGIYTKGDIFGWKSEKFLETLKEVCDRNKIEKIILNGDIFELYKYRISEIEHTHKVLLDFLRERNAVFIKGNHDIILDKGLGSYTITNSKGESIHIEHGHNADFLNGTKIGRGTGVFLMSLLKTMCKFDFINKIYLAIVKFDDEIERIPRKYNSYKYLNYALKLLKKHDVLIMGHTHKMEVHKTWYFNSKKKYLNCGSCSMGRFHGIVLDTETLWYETVKIEKTEQFQMEKETSLETTASKIEGHGGYIEVVQQ
jgi:UDP-2,3-diacylglucosamine pyrophosphatase LpxH